MTQTDYKDVKEVVPHRRVIFTGPIDEYFDFRFGKLPYRSLRFEHKTLDKAWHQPVAVVNYPQSKDYTRVTEYKHLTGQEHAKTALTYEYPSAEGDPYYPIPKAENQELFKKYERLALADSGRMVRRAARHVPLLQHGPDRRSGARHLPPHQRGASDRGGYLRGESDDIFDGFGVVDFLSRNNPPQKQFRNTFRNITV